MKSHQIFPLIISLCKKPQLLCLVFFFFLPLFLAEQQILILWIVILLEVFFEKSYLEPGSNSKMFWYPGLQNLFGLVHIKSFLQLTVQLFSPLPSHFGIFSPLLWKWLDLNLNAAWLFVAWLFPPLPDGFS